VEADLNLSVCHFFAYRVSFDLPHLASDLVGDPELRKQLSGEVDAAGAIGIRRLPGHTEELPAK
jgi:hypothetical protein